PRLAGIGTGRSAFASDRLRYLSACTPCTNQNDPARKTKMATIAHSNALMRKVRNFWSSRYTRISGLSVPDSNLREQEALSAPARAQAACPRGSRPAYRGCSDRDSRFRSDL